MKKGNVQLWLAMWLLGTAEGTPRGPTRAERAGLSVSIKGKFKVLGGTGQEKQRLLLSEFQEEGAPSSSCPSGPCTLTADSRS